MERLSGDSHAAIIQINRKLLIRSLVFFSYFAALSEAIQVMIQRIQSLFLSVAIICGVLIFFFPVASVMTAQGELSWSVTGAIGPEGLVGGDVPSNYPLLALAGLQLGLTVIVLLMFKNRKLQLKLGRVNALLMLLFLGGGVTYSFFLKPLATQANDMPHFGLALLLGLVALIMDLLALRAIQKDEDLIRSADRLR